MLDIDRWGLENRIIENIQKLDSLPSSLSESPWRGGYLNPVAVKKLSTVIESTRRRLQDAIAADLAILP